MIPFGSGEPDAVSPDAVSPDAGVVASRLTGEGAIFVGADRHSLTADGQGNYAVAWVEVPAGATTQRLVFATVSPSGQVLSGPTEIVPLAKKEVASMRLFRVDDHFVLFRNDHDTWASTAISFRARSDGTIQAQGATIGGYHHADFYRTDSGLAVAFAKNVVCASGQTEPTHQIHLRQLDADGVPKAAAILVECTGKQQLRPKAVWTGDRHVLIWSDLRTWGWRVRHIALDQNRSPLAPSHVLLEHKTSQQVSGLTHDGQGRLLASWTESGRLLHAAVSEDGALLWNEAVELHRNRDESMNTQMAGGGGGVALVWESDVGVVLPQIKLLRLDLATAPVLPPEPVLLTHPSYHFYLPQVARGSSGHGVTFMGEVEGNRALYFKSVPAP